MSLYKLGGKYIKKSIKARQGAIFFLYLQANFLLKMKIKEIVSALERFAPLPLQDGFDNAGLQIGLTDAETTGALLCLDVTEAVLDEAIASGCNLIISHHPLIFKGYKSITGKDYVERCILKAIKNDIVIYSAHTNLDNAPGGVNFKIAEKIGLKNVRILDPKESSLKKDDVLTFRTAKAKVIIRNDGTIELLSFVEQQPGNAQRYIRYRLKDFKVKKILMDNGYINPGEQYVQLRYIPALARRVK